MRGVGINKATEKIEIDRYSSASDGVTSELIDTRQHFPQLHGYPANEGQLA